MVCGDASMCVSSLLDDYLDPSVWSPLSTPGSVALVRHGSPVGERAPSAEQLNSDVLQVCLLLEGVSVFAQVRVASYFFMALCIMAA